MYKTKYLKYKNKYLLLKGGSISKIIWTGQYLKNETDDFNMNYKGSITKDNIVDDNTYNWIGKQKDINNNNNNSVSLSYNGYILNNNNEKPNTYIHMNDIKYNNIKTDHNTISADVTIESINIKNTIYSDSNHDNYNYFVIGGGQNIQYPDEFFEIGSHDSAKYGIGMDWDKIGFWEDLELYLSTKKFKAIMFDSSSGSFMGGIIDNVFKKMCNIFLNILLDNGIFIFPYMTLRNSNILQEKRILSYYETEKNLHPFKFFMINDPYDDMILCILKKNNSINSIITNNTGLYDNGVDISYINKKKYIAFNNEKTRVIEKDIIEFIKNRCI